MYRIGKHLAKGSLCDIYEALPPPPLTSEEMQHRSDDEFEFTEEGEKGKEKKDYSPPVLRNKDAAMKVEKVIKIMRDERHIEQLHREYNIMKSITHPNILKPDNILHYEGRGLGIVLPRLRGGDLISILTELQKMKRFYNTLTQSICRCLVMAIDYLHENQIAHGDIKVDNVLIDYDESMDIGAIDEHRPIVKLCDFGFSFRIAESVEEFGEKVKITKGSIPNASYEVVMAIPTSPYAVDVWALGVTLGCIVLNQHIFTASGLKGMIERREFTREMYEKFQSDAWEERLWWKETLFAPIREKHNPSRRFEKILCHCFRFHEEYRATAREVRNMKWIKFVQN